MDLESLRHQFPGANAFRFGDSQMLCDRLLGLVREGKKTATCEDARAFERNPQDLPNVGRIDIALNWDGTPALLIETLSVERVRFCDVSEAFALAEGENETLAGWREDHRAYFERNLGFFPEMELICERFKLVKDFEKASD